MQIKTVLVHIFDLLQVEHMFGVSGANIEDLVVEAHQQQKIKLILAKSESQACLMAMGVTIAIPKKLGIAFTTSGAGVLNTLPILAEAYTSQNPFLLISGLVPQAAQGQGGFQDTSGLNGTIDLTALLKPITGYQTILKSDESVIEHLLKAYVSAFLTKKPSVVLIPKNIFNATINITVDELKQKTQDLLQQILKNQNRYQLNVDWQNIDEIESQNLYLHQYEFANTDFANLKQQKMNRQTQLARLTLIKKQSNQKTVVILGENLIHVQDRNLIKKIAQILNSDIALTPVAKGLFDHSDPRFLGLTGLMGHQDVITAINQAALIVVLGSRLDQISRYGLENPLKNKNVIHMNPAFQFGETADEFLNEVIHALS